MIRCGRFSLVGVQGNGVGIFPLRCKLWRCPNCGPRKVKRAIAIARRGMRHGTVRFITITSPGSDDGATSYRELSIRWHRFQSRLHRRFGPVQYFAVVERQKRGAAHVHMVYRGSYIPQAWLSRAAGDSGFGRVADIRKAPPNVATYLAKYLTKDLTDSRATLPRYFRRVRVSHGWSDWVAPAHERRYGEWWIVDARPSHAALSAQRRGYLVVEVLGDQPEAWFQPDRVPHWIRPADLREPGILRPHMHPAALGHAA